MASSGITARPQASRRLKRGPTLGPTCQQLDECGAVARRPGLAGVLSETRHLARVADVANRPRKWGCRVIGCSLTAKPNRRDQPPSGPSHRIVIGHLSHGPPRQQMVVHRARCPIQPGAGVVWIFAEPVADGAPQLYRQLLDTPSLSRVKGIAHREQSGSLLAQRLPGGRCTEHPRSDPHPVIAMDRAQAAPADLDVCFLEKEGLPDSHRPFFGSQRVGQGPLPSHQGSRAVVPTRRMARVAGDDPGGEQRAKRLYVLRRCRHRFLHGAHGMPHLHPGVPQRVQHLTHRIGGHVAQQHHIDVGLEAHL